MVSKVLVTGATGFIGGHLVEALLKRGGEVRCLVRELSNTEMLRRLDVEIVTPSLSDEQGLANACAGCDIVYHLAGLTCAIQPQDLHRVNAEGVRKIAAACGRQAAPPVLLLVSSVAAAGPIARGEVREESDPPCPISDYGRSKRAGEQEAEKWAAEGPVTIVRPGIVFGPRNREMLPIFATIRRFRCHPMAGFGAPPLSLLHVSDAVQIILNAAERGQRIANGDDASAGRGYYFATTDDHPDYAQLGRMIRRTLGRPFAPIVPLPVLAANILATGIEQISRWRRRPNSFNRDKIIEATATSWACRSAAAQRDFSFEPEMPLQQRIQETSDWYLANRWL